MNLLWTEMESYIQKDLVKPQIKKLYDQAAGNFEKYAELILSSRDLSVIDSHSYEYMLKHIDSIKYEYNFEKMLKEVFKDRIKYFDAIDHCLGFALGDENFIVDIDCEKSDDNKIAYLVLEDEIESITNYLFDSFSFTTHIVGSFSLYMSSYWYNNNKKQRFDKVLDTLTGDYDVFKCFVNGETPCISLVIFLQHY